MRRFCASKYNFPVDSDENGRILLFNTSSGAVCWFEKDTYALFCNSSDVDIVNLPKDIVRLGYVVPSEVDELHSLLFLKSRYIYSSSPITLSYVIAPTLGCNLNCGYCYERGNSSSQTMSALTWEKIESFILSECEKYPSVRNVHITWFGGEPCLCLESIVTFSKRIIEQLAHQSIEYTSSMVTNGVLFNRETARILAENCGMKKVQVTLDGMANHYSRLKGCDKKLFNMVIDNIANTCDLATIRVRINVDEHNQSNLVPLIEHLMNERNLCGKLYVYFARILNYNGGGNSVLTSQSFEIIRKRMTEYMIDCGYEDSLEIELPQKIATPCRSMRNYTCVIGPEGELYRCEHCLGIPEWIIGDVETGFYHNKKDEEFLTAQLPEICMDCNLLPICAGGCVADRIIDGIAFDCDAFRSKTKQAVLMSVKKRVALKG